MLSDNTTRRLAGRYDLGGEIGRGGMGSVHEATDITLNRRVAVKLLTQVDPEMTERFRREAKSAASLSHPHIIQVSEFVAATAFEPAFIVMERLDGENLAALLRRIGILPLPRALSIAIQVASALGAAHRAGIVHRDVKPQNIFLVRSRVDADFVKLMDFGIAKDVHLEGGGPTVTGELLGTSHYMSPEQILSPKSVGPTADIWALGVVLYVMLAGESPYGSHSPPEILHAAMRGEMVPLASRCSAASAGVLDVVSRALTVAPEKRFANGDEMAHALEALVRDVTRTPEESSSSPSPSPSESSSPSGATRIDTTLADAESHPQHPRLARRGAFLFVAGLGSVVLVALVASLAAYTVVTLRSQDKGPSVALPLPPQPTSTVATTTTTMPSTTTTAAASPVVPANGGANLKSKRAAILGPRKNGGCAFRSDADRPHDDAKFGTIEPAVARCYTLVDLSKCEGEHVDVTLRVYTVNGVGQRTSASMSSSCRFVDDSPFRTCIRPTLETLSFGPSLDPEVVTDSEVAVEGCWKGVWR